MPPLILIPLAFAAAGVIGYAGYRARALSGSGAVAAGLVGSAIFGFGGLAWAVLLVLFFAASSALSFFKVSDPRKRQAAETFDKGGRRDAGQVVANGGVAALLAVISFFAEPGALQVLFGALAGALAAATADTWATELGVLSRAQPRLVTTGRAVPAGTSGAITLAGTGASLLGAGFIGLFAALAALLPAFGLNTHLHVLAPFVAATAGGMAGSLADSVLGATVQASYWCPLCQKPTESRMHRCGTPTLLVSGFPLVNNDAVNFLATGVGALVGAAISVLL